MAHCYGTLAVGRDLAADSGNAGELYVVIGHAPRQLDRNATVLGRVLDGIERLSSLPRGTGPLGFYETPGERVPIGALRFADELPESARTPLEVLRTESATFTQIVEARRNRRDEWYKQPAGHIDLCSVPLPVRRVPR
jgi:peptidylprolyl isomerase